MTEMYYLYGFGGWKSKIKVSAGPCSLWHLQGNLPLPLPSFLLVTCLFFFFLTIYSFWLCCVLLLGRQGSPWLLLHPCSFCPAASPQVLPLRALGLYTVFSPGHWLKLPFTCTDTSHWVRAHSTLQSNMMSSWFHLQRPCCQIKTHPLWALGVGSRVYLFWGRCKSTHNVIWF